MRAVKSVSIDSERRVIITYLDGSTEILFPNCIWCDSEALRQLIKDLLEEKADAITQTIENVTIASFADGADEALIRKLLVSIDPIQEGTGDPSPENVRVISGRTGLSVVRCGKNLIDDSKQALNGAHTTLFVGSVNSADYLYFLLPGVYTFSCKFSNGAHYGAFYRRSDETTQTTIWSPTGSSTSASFTVTKSGFYRFWLYRASADGGVSIDDVSDVMLELGSEATEYEPYKGNTYSVNWESEAGTVYGGTLDVITGKLVVDRVSYVLDGVTNKASDLVQYPQDSDYVNLRGMYRVIVVDLPSGAPYNAQNISSHFRWQKYTGRKNALPDSLITSTAAGVITWASSTYTTLEEFNGYLADQYNGGTPVTLVYELGTPITCDVTPQEVRTLLGENNIWSDSGNILELEYVADIKLYIDETQTDQSALSQPTVIKPVTDVTEKEQIEEEE